MQAKESGKEGHSQDMKTQRILKPGSILCENSGRNTSILNEMAEAYETGEKQEFVLQNKNIK